MESLTFSTLTKLEVYLFLQSSHMDFFPVVMFKSFTLLISDNNLSVFSHVNMEYEPFKYPNNHHQWFKPANILHLDDGKQKPTQFNHGPKISLKSTAT